MINITANRLAWLRKLREEKSAPRPARSRVGYDCMHRGWTQWVYVRRGQPNSTWRTREWCEQHLGNTWWVQYEINPMRLEQLTQAGHDILAAYEKEHPDA